MTIVQAMVMIILFVCIGFFCLFLFTGCISQKVRPPFIQSILRATGGDHVAKRARSGI